MLGIGGMIGFVLLEWYDHFPSNPPFPSWRFAANVHFAIQPFGIMVSVIDIIATHRGLGHHAADLNPDEIERYLKTLYIVLLFYNPGLAFFKWSFLAFYIRVFPVVKSLRISSYIVGTLVLLWVLGTQFSFVFQCAPISAAWTGKGKCIKTSHIYIAQSVPTLVFDIVILALPVKTIWNAQLKTAQKWSVMGVFLLGGLVTVISIVRLVTTLTSTDQDPTCKSNYPACCVPRRSALTVFRGLY